MTRRVWLVAALLLLPFAAPAQAKGGLADLEKQIRKVEKKVRKRANAWIKARRSQGMHCPICLTPRRSANCKLCGGFRVNPPRGKALLKFFTRTAVKEHVASVKKRYKRSRKANPKLLFLRELIFNGKLLPGHGRSMTPGSSGFGVSGGRVLWVRISSTHARVQIEVVLGRGQKRVETTTWAKSAGKFCIQTKYDAQLTSLLDESYLPATGKGLKQAVDDGLGWLRRHQGQDGRWSVKAWHTKGCCAGDGKNFGDPRYDVGVTGLALLAFFGSKKFEDPAVRPALAWLVDQQRKQDGAIGFKHGRGEEIYNHASAAWALATAYSKLKGAALLTGAQKALDLIVKARNPTMAWKYGVRTGRNDTSVTTWMLAALAAGRKSGLQVPDEPFQGGLKWLDKATDSFGNTGYERPGGDVAMLAGNDKLFDRMPSMTAAAIYGRMLAGEAASARAVKQGFAHINGAMPLWGSDTNRTVNLYYWWHATKAFSLAKWAHGTGWAFALRDALLQRQQKNGCGKGSWNPVGEWCKVGGRVYSTALCVQMLQTLRKVRKKKKSKKKP